MFCHDIFCNTTKCQLITLSRFFNVFDELPREHLILFYHNYFRSINVTFNERSKLTVGLSNHFRYSNCGNNDC